MRPVQASDVPTDFFAEPRSHLTARSGAYGILCASIHWRIVAIFVYVLRYPCLRQPLCSIPSQHTRHSSTQGTKQHDRGSIPLTILTSLCFLCRHLVFLLDLTTRTVHTVAIVPEAERFSDPLLLGWPTFAANSTLLLVPWFR